MTTTPDRVSYRDLLIQAAAESMWGEGCYPFNEATGWEIRYQAELTADYILAFLKDKGIEFVRPMTEREKREMLRVPMSGESDAR